MRASPSFAIDRRGWSAAVTAIRAGSPGLMANRKAPATLGLSSSESTVRVRASGSGSQIQWATKSGNSSPSGAPVPMASPRAESPYS